MWSTYTHSRTSEDIFDHADALVLPSRGSRGSETESTLCATHPAIQSQVSGETHGRALAYIAESLSEATHRAYRVDWQQFTIWCDDRNLSSLPALPVTVVHWLADVAQNYRPSSLERKLASISKAHRVADYPSPTGDPIVRTTMQGIRRTKQKMGQPVSPVKKSPFLAVHLRAAVKVFPRTLCGQRDKALLLLGYAGAFRRSKLSNLDVGNVEFFLKGVLVHLKNSKTNQDGSRLECKDIGYGLHEETCPVRAVKTWLEEAGIDRGPVFRPITKCGVVRNQRLSGTSIAKIVKLYGEAVGLDPAELGAHSLRAGFVTDHVNRGTPMPLIMAMTGHRSEGVLLGYYRKAGQFATNMTAETGL